MATELEIKNLKEFIQKLEKASNRILSRAERGLVEAGQFLQGKSMEIVPVQTGYLRASAFTRKVSQGHVIVGYTALYAAYVHENPNAAHGQAFNIKHAERISRANQRLYFSEGEPLRSGVTRRVSGQKAGTRRSTYFNRGPNQQYKFLEKPARENRADMLRIIASWVRR